MALAVMIWCVWHCVWSITFWDWFSKELSQRKNVFGFLHAICIQQILFYLSFSTAVRVYHFPLLHDRCNYQKKKHVKKYIKLWESIKDNYEIHFQFEIDTSGYDSIWKAWKKDDFLWFVQSCFSPGVKCLSLQILLSYCYNSRLHYSTAEKCQTKTWDSNRHCLISSLTCTLHRVQIAIWTPSCFYFF